MMAHPDDNAVAAFMAGELRGAEATGIELHMDRCDECRVLLAELARLTPDGRTRSDTRAGHDSTLPSGDEGEDYALGEILCQRFCLVRLLGRGGMGQVYEADDLTLGIRVALKLLPRHVAQSATYLEHLHQEIRLGRRISHPNVCRIYDLGNCNGINFLTMELVDGETLADRLARGVLDPPLGRSVARQVVAAMAAAHRQGVIHRDLKPGNIMIDDSGHVKVMDFGLARDQNSAPSGRFGPVGTPGYWAPEQSRGESTDAASDVFALGRVLHEILAAEAVRPSRRRGMTGLPRRYRPLVQRCVARDQRDRFANASQVEADLDRLLARRRKNLTRALSLAPGVAGVTVAVALAVFASRDTAPTVAAAPAAAVDATPVPSPVVVTPLVVQPEPAPASRTSRPPRRARASSPAPAPVPVVEEAKPVPVAATPPPPAPPVVDAVSVQRKLDRLTGQSRSRSLSPETSQAVKRLFSDVHAAYFRDDYARADALLDKIARHLEPR